ncbi:hypothetical protein T484DRAFT_1769588, partial [Baffinella frigidus]
VFFPFLSKQYKPRAKHNSVYLKCYFDGDQDPGPDEVATCLENQAALDAASSARRSLRYNAARLGLTPDDNAVVAPQDARFSPTLTVRPASADASSPPGAISARRLLGGDASGAGGNMARRLLGGDAGSAGEGSGGGQRRASINLADLTMDISQGNGEGQRGASINLADLTIDITQTFSPPDTALALFWLIWCPIIAAGPSPY